jgi:hypothetical protein
MARRFIASLPRIRDVMHALALELDRFAQAPRATQAPRAAQAAPLTGSISCRRMPSAPRWLSPRAGGCAHVLARGATTHLQRKSHHPLAIPGTPVSGWPRRARNRTDHLAFIGWRTGPTSEHGHEPEVHGVVSASQECASILFRRPGAGAATRAMGGSDRAAEPRKRSLRRAEALQPKPWA